eukprot:scaffold176757_cov30-Tisochrysis_lutea.AAC.1
MAQHSAEPFKLNDTGLQARKGQQSRRNVTVLPHTVSPQGWHSSTEHDCTVALLGAPAYLLGLGGQKGARVQECLG